MLEAIDRPSLADRTRQLVKERSRTLTFRCIHQRTEIPESWLKMFLQGKIKDPSVNRIQKLYEFLTDTKLDY